MEILWKVKPYDKDTADIILLMAGEDSKESLLNLSIVKEYLPWLKETSPWEDFEAKKNQLLITYLPAGSPFKKLVLIGLGKKSELTMDNLYQCWATTYQRLKEGNSKKIAISMENFEILFENPSYTLREFLFTGLSSLYEYKEYKTKLEGNSKTIETQLILLEREPDAAIIEAITSVEVLKPGMFRARNLINAPSNDITPERFVKEAKEIAEKYNLTYTIISQEEAEKMGMGAFVAVAKGSANKGYIIILEYTPKGCEEEKPLVFVGKGITFDTGGISIKPASGMELMKHDMAGAATVLGAMETIGIMKPPRRVVGVMPCAENMPDGKAYRPGDILKTFSGQTVEVITTDAEGRLILCDALTYAIKNYSPALIVDLATLTGACIIALGDRVAGVMGNSQEALDKIISVGNSVGEKMWPLPLYDFYFEDLKSDVADFKNVGNRKAGTIIGGMFLKQFISDEIPWVHIDIAGPAWAEKPWFYQPKGATSFGLRTLVEIVRAW